MSRLKIPSLRPAVQSLALPSLSYSDVPPTPRSSVAAPAPAWTGKPPRPKPKVSFRHTPDLIASPYHFDTDSERADSPQEDKPPPRQESPAQLSPETPTSLLATPSTPIPSTPTPLLSTPSHEREDKKRASRPLSERFKRASRADLKRLRQDVTRLLSAKAVRLRHARRRLRLFQGCAVYFYTTLGYMAAGLSLAILLDQLGTRKGVTARIVCIVVPIALFFTGVLVGVLLKLLRFPPAAFVVNFASVDYAETSSLILNLARFITDIDSAFSGTERLQLLEAATNLLTDALHTKSLYEKQRPVFMPTVWEVVFAVPLLLATLASASLIALTKSDDAPSSKEDGYEALLGDRLSVGCVSFSLGCSCFMPRQRTFLLKVFARSEARNARDWSAIVLPV